MKVRLNGVVAVIQQLLVTEVTAARFLPTINKEISLLSSKATELPLGKKKKDFKNTLSVGV